MAYKENFPPSLGAGTGAGTLLPMLSPNKNPALIRQRDHSACRSPDTPLKVRKTRENLRQSIYADVPPPCLHVHGSDTGQEHDTSADAISFKDSHRENPVQDTTSSPLRYYKTMAQVPSKPQRQKSISRGMLSKVKQGIANKSKSAYSIRAAETGGNLIRRLSGKRKQSYEIDRRVQSYEATRESSEDDLQPELGFGQRSLTASSASTMDILGDYLMDETPSPSSSSNGFLDTDTAAVGTLVKDYDSMPSPKPSSPSPQHTPRPLRREVRSAFPAAPPALAVRSPCVSLRISMDCNTVDVSSNRNVWIAVEATVEENTITLIPGTQNSSSPPHLSRKTSSEAAHVSGSRYDYGRITSLRLCYKATGDCLIREVVGQKCMKNVSIGQKCSLFIKIHVPEHSAQSISDNASDQESLFAKLESLVGTLEVDILHIEARHRLSVLPSDNVIAIRRVCRVRRPDSSSRWSTARDLGNELQDPGAVYRSLAEHLAARFSPSQSIELLQRYVGPACSDDQEIFRIVNKRGTGLVKHELDQQMLKDDYAKPSACVITKDTIENSAAVAAGPHDSLFSGTDVANLFHSMDLDHHPAFSSTPALSSIPKPTTGRTSPVIWNNFSTPLVYQNIAKPCLEPLSDDQEAEDTARQLWRSIRRTSLSTQQMDVLSTPEQVARLEAEDAGIRMLRRTAIANKRSVGAETLKEWKWDEEMEG